MFFLIGRYQSINFKMLDPIDLINNSYLLHRIMDTFQNNFKINAIINITYAFHFKSRGKLSVIRCYT